MKADVYYNLKFPDYVVLGEGPGDRTFDHYLGGGLSDRGFHSVYGGELGCTQNEFVNESGLMP